MQIFISGTGTDIGKTIVASWLAVHTGFSYFKPIQTGSAIDRDSLTVHQASGATIYPESFCYKTPVSPHLAAHLENSTIDIRQIVLPNDPNLLIEGAGGLLVPITETLLMIDLIQYLETPVLLVCRSELGTLNHTLLSIEALRARNIPLLGVIMNGALHPENKQGIEFYGATQVLAEFLPLNPINRDTLTHIPLPIALHHALKGTA